MFAGVFLNVYRGSYFNNMLSHSIDCAGSGGIGYSLRILAWISTVPHTTGGTESGMEEVEVNLLEWQCPVVPFIKIASDDRISN